MNITCKCHSTPYLLLLTLLLTCSVILSTYVLTEYGWEICPYTHALFKQSIVSIFNSLVTGCLSFYIVFMPDRGHVNYNNSIAKFNIGYLLQTIIVIVNTYLFFDSGLYDFKFVSKSECNMFYYYAIYSNVLLGCLPQYVFTICFATYYITKYIYIKCSKSSGNTILMSSKSTSPMFINPEEALDYDDSELELLFDARPI